MSTDGGVTEIAGAVSAGSTVTVTALEGSDAASSELSNTCSSKLHVPVMVKVPVDAVGLLPEVQPNGPPRAL
jgi:hypothetical protein